MPFIFQEWSTPPHSKQAFRGEELVRKHLQDHQDFGSHLFPTSNLRPKSLAVPGMTTSTSLSPSMFNFLQEPQVGIKSSC